MALVTRVFFFHLRFAPAADMQDRRKRRRPVRLPDSPGCQLPTSPPALCAMGHPGRPTVETRSVLLLLFLLLLVSPHPSAVITGEAEKGEPLASASTSMFSISVNGSTDTLALYRKGKGFSWNMITACELDTQCGRGMCCAVSLWIRSLRMCTPIGQEGDDCHPMSHKGKRLHHTCPCLPNLACITGEEGRSRCLPAYKYQDYNYL
ncbi:AVIToxin-VAR2 [Merluccius polli]|uniref:AVIToxin-VAR2 n=1 Tax=Merluccius polli TaxID=89951 RepID=A0AA47M7B2_MERPO|nr:AVIToxin-VAR2 [Merluccius polli]